MYEQVEKPKENKSRAIANSVTQKKSNVKQGFGFVDNRPEAVTQRKLQEMANNHPQPIQRQILGESGFSKSLKLADNHGNFSSTLGFTPPTVNFGHIMKGQDVVDNFQGKEGMVNVVESDENDFTASVGTVPRNHVGYMMYLPQAGPWISEVSKKNILATLGVQDNGRNPKGTIILEITGPNGHEKLAKQIEKHEMVHAKDNEKVRDAILVPWDKNLMGMKQRNDIFRGESEEIAKNNLWKAAGGTLEEVGAAADKAWTQSSDTFHQHKTGKTMLHEAGMKINADQTRAQFSYYLTV